MSNVWAVQQAREIAYADGQDYSELLRLSEQEIYAARQETENSLELAVNADGERQQAISELRQIKASYMALQARLDSLLLDNSTDARVPTPDTLDEVEGWAQTYLSGQVELHPRAIKAARNSGFRDVPLVYKTLLLMRDIYVPMRRTGGKEHKNAFEHGLAELGLENGPCFTQNNKAKKYGDVYFVPYHGSRRELDMHLKGKSNRDKRFGFRLYYFWDAETQRVVVGHLPGHLKTDAT